MSAKTKTKKPSERKSYTVAEKCEAVLSIWSERRTMTEVSEELQVSYPVVQKWQNLAMESMIEALAPVSQQNQELPPALSPRLRKMLSRRITPQLPAPRSGRLEERLKKIQKEQSS